MRNKKTIILAVLALFALCGYAAWQTDADSAQRETDSTPDYL